MERIVFGEILAFLMILKLLCVSLDWYQANPVCQIFIRDNRSVLPHGYVMNSDCRDFSDHDAAESVREGRLSAHQVKNHLFF